MYAVSGSIFEEIQHHTVRIEVPAGPVGAKGEPADVTVAVLAFLVFGPAQSAGDLQLLAEAVFTVGENGLGFCFGLAHRTSSVQVIGAGVLELLEQCTFGAGNAEHAFFQILFEFIVDQVFKQIVAVREVPDTVVVDIHFQSGDLRVGKAQWMRVTQRYVLIVCRVFVGVGTYDEVERAIEVRKQLQLVGLVLLEVRPGQRLIPKRRAGVGGYQGI